MAKPTFRRPTRGELSMAQWHDLLRRVMIVAALALIGASFVSIRWALVLIGLRGPWEPLAWMAALALEVLTAGVASTVTTTRTVKVVPGRGGAPARERRVYHWHLWFIFSFLLALAQAANVGHALTTVSEHTAELPPTIPVGVFYGFAVGFALLVPLGGTFGVHVAGFLRANGAGADWDADGKTRVSEPAPLTAPRADPAPVRAPAPRPARATTPEPAPRPEPAPVRAAPRPAPAAAPAVPAPVRASAEFEAVDGPVRPPAGMGPKNAAEWEAWRLYSERRLAGETVTGKDLAAVMSCTEQHGRKVRVRFDAAYEATLIEALGDDGPAARRDERAAS